MTTDKISGVRLVVFLLPLILVILLNQPARSWDIFAGEGLKLDGSVRWRSELDGKDFDNSTAMPERTYLRTRLGLEFDKINDALVYIQVQDSRNIGSNSATLTNDTNLGLHQGYIKLIGFPFEQLSLQVGRFKATYGRQRLIGAVGWSNVGRSFDGARASFKSDDLKIDIFSLKVQERSFDEPPNHKDQVFYGVYGNLWEEQLDLFFLLDWDMMESQGDYDLARWTAGTYLNYNFTPRVGLQLDAAYQGGYQGADDISAFMVASDLFYKLDSIVKSVGIGFDITSGDDDLSDDMIEYFDNLYYTGHKFRGFMDLFVGSARSGLMDLIFRTQFSPLKQVEIAVDIHHFQTMQDYITLEGDESKAIGQEIDLTAKHDWRNGLGLQAGASAFLPANDYMTDSDPAYWFYAMITADF
ncbi:MAG: hypothetical protein GF315_15125 [candidate division Zixibacteria bacterium]|nr:hypothetical protein [candidate division Zixibacteria bacterium]